MQYNVVSKAELSNIELPDTEPTEAEFEQAIERLKGALSTFSIRSSFRDEPALIVASHAKFDEPSFLLALELSNPDAMNLDTIDFIGKALEELAPSFSLVLRFEYNYLSIDFIAFITRETTYFSFSDDSSQQKFGL